MIVILIGIIIGLGIGLRCAKAEPLRTTRLNVIFTIIIAILCGNLGVFLSLIIPTDYEEEWELRKQTELVSLSNTTETEGGGFLYVNVSARNVYTYRYEISSELGTDTSSEYETATISENVIESEDSNCEVPMLLEYIRKPKATIWTFGSNAEPYIKYVFYVPKGTIQREIKLE